MKIEQDKEGITYQEGLDSLHIKDTLLMDNTFEVDITINDETVSSVWLDELAIDVMIRQLTKMKEKLYE